mmetsp:Transcript_12242/g.26989  ORF Transcript_12242/g.26989 Transcript_12242/m.26989 type:complete len:239 (+) Transcript_12242:722-1438(+)
MVANRVEHFLGVEGIVRGDGKVADEIDQIDDHRDFAQQIDEPNDQDQQEEDSEPKCASHLVGAECRVGHRDCSHHICWLIRVHILPTWKEACIATLVQCLGPVHDEGHRKALITPSVSPQNVLAKVQGSVEASKTRTLSWYRQRTVKDARAHELAAAVQVDGGAERDHAPPKVEPWTRNGLALSNRLWNFRSQKFLLFAIISLPVGGMARRSHQEILIPSFLFSKVQNPLARRFENCL